MIAEMKKLMLFMPDSAVDIDAELTVLGQLGVMHITPLQAAKHDSIERVDARIKQLEKAISVLNRYNNEHYSDSEELTITDYSKLERGEVFLMEKVLDAEKHRKELENIKLNLTSDLEWFENWGNITLKDIKELNEKGIRIKLYLLADRELKRISNREDIQVVGKIDELNQVVLLTKEANENLDFQELDSYFHSFNIRLFLIMPNKHRKFVLEMFESIIPRMNGT